MAHSLDGRLALVVGGSGGIGAASARLLAGAGARVVVTHTARSAEAAASLANSLPGAGHLALPADVADTAPCLRCAMPSGRGAARRSTPLDPPNRCRTRIWMRWTMR
jgi:NAD(P)-dependent dehydrogenase (short-subunit alcohol dehydrogenase family)